MFYFENWCFILKIDRIHYAIRVEASCLVRSRLCSLTRHPSKIDSLPILCGAARRAASGTLLTRAAALLVWIGALTRVAVYLTECCGAAVTRRSRVWYKLAVRDSRFQRASCRNFATIVSPQTDLISPAKGFMSDSTCEQAIHSGRLLLFQKAFTYPAELHHC